MNARLSPSPYDSSSSLELIPVVASASPRAEGVPQGDAEQDHALALARLLPPSEHWRLYADLKDRVRFIDIETTGLAPEDLITLVGISDGFTSTVLVRGRDLHRERMAALLDGAGLLVTFNGKSFDLPRLRRAFPGLPWHLPHFDLAVEGRRLGLGGGLKKVERRLGYTRPRDLRGVDGPGAVRLWRAHCQGDPRALRRLVRYCRADVRALVHLAERIYERLERRHGPEGPGWLPPRG